MKTMRTIKLFGGPAHGRIETVPYAMRRVKIAVHDGPPYSLAPVINDVNCGPPSTCKYYVREYSESGITEAGANVHRSMWIGLYEGADLFLRERYELMDTLSRLPWQWRDKPNFLTQFDQWFEYMLAEVGWKTPNVS